MRVVFEFSGGPLDGELYTDADRDPRTFDEAMVHVYYQASGKGAMGKCFVTVSPRTLVQMMNPCPEDRGSAQGHKYEVVDCQETSTEVRVRVRYVTAIRR